MRLFKNRLLYFRTLIVFVIILCFDTCGLRLQLQRQDSTKHNTMKAMAI